MAEVVQRFSCSPLTVSCSACFASGLSDNQLKAALEVGDRTLLIHTSKLKNKGFRGSLSVSPDQFSPVVRDPVDLIASPT